MSRWTGRFVSHIYRQSYHATYTSRLVEPLRIESTSFFLPSHQSCNAGVLQAIIPPPTITGALGSFFTDSLKKLSLIPS